MEKRRLSPVSLTRRLSLLVVPTPFPPLMHGRCGQWEAWAVLGLAAVQGHPSSTRGIQTAQEVGSQPHQHPQGILDFNPTALRNTRNNMGKLQEYYSDRKKLILKKYRLYDAIYILVNCSIHL